MNRFMTHGDAMIVDPWGIVLDRLPLGPGRVCAPIERDRVAEVRRGFPAIEHRRLLCR